MAAPRKIFYVLSHIEKSMGFEWTALGLNDQIDLTFILLNPKPSSLEKFLLDHHVRVVRMEYKSKADLPAAFIRLCWLFLKERPSLVHTHMFDATLAGLAAAWITGVKRRVYTRHTSTFHHVYFPGAVKYDKLTNLMATEIISISQATDYSLLKLEKVSPKKMRKIPHGFDLSSFTSIPTQRIEALKHKWRLNSGIPYIGVVARHIEWKGIQFIIPAFKKFLVHYPDACLILTNASGPYHLEITRLLEEIPAKNYRMIKFEEDMAALYQVFDMYVHTPVDPTCEAFGQTYVEAIAAGIPSIFTLSGIALEFIRHNENALIVEFRNSDQIYDALMQLWKDGILRTRLIENGKKSIDPSFTDSVMISKLMNFYNE